MKSNTLEMPLQDIQSTHELKAVVGIDVDGNYRRALALLSRLKFDQVVAELVHVSDLPLAEGATVGPYTYAGYPVLEEERRVFGEKLLSQAHAFALSQGLEATSFYTEGTVTGKLVHRADETHADLVAVGSAHKSKYRAIILGSVGRGLAIGSHRSILIAKQKIRSKEGLTAVFATDGSPYADDCLRLLMRMNPRGIERLIVLTAIEDSDDRRSRDEVKKHVDSLVNHLLMEKFAAEGHIVEGNPTEAIDAMMIATKADLLVMGARGHGILNRLLLGSVSMHEVEASPHSVLLLRSN